MTSCEKIRQARIAVPKATAMCERAIHAAKCQRLKSAVAGSGASGRQQLQTICRRTKYVVSVTTELECINRRTWSNLEGKLVACCEWPQQLQV
jgi:hypothetical protein